MSTAKIAAVIQSVPVKKESLRKAFEVLQSYSSSLSSFTLEWKDIDGHLSAIEKSIEERFKDLQAKEIEKSAAVEAADAAGASVEEKPAASPAPAPAPALAAVAAAVEEKSVPAKASAAAELESYPRPELVYLCSKMDGKGLRSFICDNWNEQHAIRSELNPALRAAPDPALLVLDALDNFFDGPNHAIRRTCVSLLERIQAVASEIKPAVRERAKKLATEWRGEISDSAMDNCMEAMGFLQLLISYGLASEFEVDDLLDLLVIVSRRNSIVDLCKNLGLTENVPDLIQKLCHKGKQLEAVKVVYAFNLLDKFPPVPLLKSYLKETKVNNFTQNEAIGKEIASLKSALKALEEYRLESEYPREILQKQIAQLQQQKSAKKKNQKAAKKRIALAAEVSNSKTQQQPNKRPRPSTINSAPAVAAHPLPPLVQSQSQLGLMDRSPYMGMGMAGAGPYGLAASGSLYNHAGPNLSGAPMALGGNRSLYDRPATYTLSGRPTSYSSSLYP